MGKYKRLAKNTGILALGQLGSKILVFLLVPLYTNVLSTEEYGYYDLITTTASLLLPILTLNIGVSSQRFSLDKDANHAAIARISFKYVFIGNLIACCILIANYLLDVSKILSNFSLYFVAIFFTDSVNTILTAISIGREKVKGLSISGALSTLTCVVLNILFLIVFKWGLTGYFLSYILSNVVQIVYLSIILHISKFLCDKTKYEEYQHNMLAYSRPQIANNISWWINNALDRYIVTAFCGVGINGIYSIAYKIPTMLNIVSGIFSQAWTLSAIKNYSKEDEDNFFTNTYSLYNFALVISCSGLILLNKLLAKLLFANDFYSAWVFAPFLVISSIFGALSGFLGSFFSAVKNGKLFIKSTLIGAAVNTLLNFILVYSIGAVGAAIATEISYIVIWVLRSRDAERYVNLNINYKRDVIVYIILNAQAVLMYFINNNFLQYGIQFALTFMVLILNMKELKLFFSMLNINCKHSRGMR